MTRGFEAVSRVWKIILLAAAALLGLVLVVFFGFFSADQESTRAARNPCERDCLQDSGGLVGCRQECASHPLTYGPASQKTSH
jgi:hypothetical protein